MDLLLIRHAEPARVGPGEAGSGPADPQLTPAGRTQAGRLATWLAGDPEPIAALLASPLRRARETAEPVAAALARRVETRECLGEYDRHADSYIPMEELRETRDHRWQAMVEGRWEELGGESPEAFRARVVPCIEGVVAEFPARRVALVCHGGVINVYLAHILGLDRHLWFEPAYSSVSVVAASRDGVRSLVTLNDTAHLVARRHEARPAASDTF